MAGDTFTPETIRFVCATRENRETFLQRTALGRSLSVYKYPFVELRLFESNTTALPVVYNRAIDEAIERPAILVFIHDDVLMCDYFWPEHIVGALQEFEVVGLAGNRRRVANQPSWVYVNDQLTPDAPEYLSGVIGHGKHFPPDILSIYGAPCQEVKLLDGLMLACRSRVLHETSIRFDEQFDFHFYDMDFCRQAELHNLRMGTWAISVVHESGGNFRTAGWKSGYAKYISKWKS